jgi:colanic acid biosynthesis protein WcaH
VSTFIPQPLYNAILAHVPVACVDVAVVCDGCVLLVRREDPPARGQWWVPGGRVLKGERMKEAARRKAREEVGVDCHVGPIIHTAETIFPDGPGGIPVHSINSCFLLYPVQGAAHVRVRLDAHHSAWRWAAAVEDDLHPYVRQCLLGAGLDPAPGPSPDPPVS